MAPTSSDGNSSEDTKKKIYNDLNERAELKHNYGQPKKAPHASAGHTTAKFLTNCAEEHANSLQCIERNYQNRSACEPFFEAYKACRKEENDRRLEANAAKYQSNNSAHSFSCIAYGSRSYRSFTSLGAITKPTLGLLSFDLDDTLFPTGEVVRSANKVMMARMHRIGCVDETIAGFLENTRSIRKSLNEPITYRDLRKNAIRETLLKSLEFKSSDNLRNIDALVEECYDAWVNERHAAAERFVFDGAVETLRTLRQTYPRVCIAAITNGAGNPFAMSETLEPFFDLRVSGEDDGVFPHRKPHPFIYQYTLQQYGKSNHNDHVWCHVGDCLANDVGASAACGAQAIWMCTGEDEDMAASRLVDTKRVPEWSTASTSELERRAQQVSEGENSMSAKIGRLAELPAAIEAVLQSC